MAHSDKNIVITPNVGSTTADPQIVFSGANASLGPQNITVSVYPTENGTLSFEGSAGQLFSITNSLSGTIFSVNDVSGIPSIEVLDTGLVKFAQYSGNVLIGTGTDNGTDKLQVAGTISATGTVTAPTFSGALSGNATTATTLQTARTINGVSFNGSANITLPTVNTSGDQTIAGIKTFTTRLNVDTAQGEILITPTGWRASDRAAIKVRSKGDTPAEIDLRNTSGSFEPGWHLSARGGTESRTLQLYRFGMTTAGVADSSSFTLLYSFAANGTLSATTFSGALSGNATTATTLQTARTIGGVSFNGSANINLPGVNAAGNQNTTGSAASVSGTTTAALPTAALASGTANSTTYLRGDRTWATVSSSGVTTGKAIAMAIVFG